MTRPKVIKERGGVKEDFSLDLVHEADLQDAVSWQMVGTITREIDRLYVVARSDAEQINREHARSALNEILKRLYANAAET